jgi:hypothetical protein
MKKVFMVLVLLALAVTGVFAQNYAADTDLRKELHSYIDAIPAQNLYALKPLLSLLSGSYSDRSELHGLLDSIPERNIDAVKTLLLALAAPSNNAMAGTNLPQERTAEAVAPFSATRASTSANTSVGVSKGPLSIGGGGLFDWSLNNSVDISSSKIDYELVSFGAFAFLDAKYIELSVGPSFGFARYEVKGGGISSGNVNMRLFQLDVSLLGKIPIELSGGKFAIFPMLGLSYNHVFFGISGINYLTTMALSDLSQLGALGGLGFDVYLTKSVYLRSEGLFHFRLPFWGTMDVMGQSNSKYNFGMGPRVKIGIGYRF